MGLLVFIDSWEGYKIKLHVCFNLKHNYNLTRMAIAASTTLSPPPPSSPIKETKGSFSALNVIFSKGKTSVFDNMFVKSIWNIRNNRLYFQHRFSCVCNANFRRKKHLKIIALFQSSLPFYNHPIMLHKTHKCLDVLQKVYCYVLLLIFKWRMNECSSYWIL